MRLFSSLKTSLHFVSKLKIVSFFISSDNSLAILEKFRINFRQQLINLRNDCVSLTIIGSSYSSITQTFLGSSPSPFLDIIQPRKLMLFLQNSHLNSLSGILYYLSFSSTFFTCCTYSSYNFKNIRISSRQAITNLSRYSLSALLMYSQNEDSAFVSPKDITKYLQTPHLIQNAIFYSSPSTILIR